VFTELNHSKYALVSLNSKRGCSGKDGLFPSFALRIEFGISTEILQILILENVNP